MREGEEGPYTVREGGVGSVCVGLGREDLSRMNDEKKKKTTMQGYGEEVGAW